MSEIFDGRLPPPRFAAIETTMFCNLRCHFCVQYQDGTTVRGPHMDAETFERVSDLLFPHLETFQPSVSGEPLMSKGLDRVLAKAAEHDVRAEYYSNGTLLNERMARLILPTLGTLHISFDGATRETFELLRAGADYDTVVANVKRIVALARQMPAPQRPLIGFACTLMQQNVRELPDLVDLAADLGLDFLKAAHVMPGTSEFRHESLYHAQDLARQCIERACQRAEARGLPFSVQPLDNLIAAVAESERMSASRFRSTSTQDGIVATLPARRVCADRLREAPRGTRSAPPPPPVEAARMPDSIWTCDFLWQKLYVGHEGNCMPCCIPGVPSLGSLQTGDLEAIWNGPIERSMRVGLARKDPAPCCKGCQHIRPTDDRQEIERLLQGRRLPAESPPLPAALRGVHEAGVEAQDSRTEVRAPTLEWVPAEGSEGYEVQISLDGFRAIVFSTLWHDVVLPDPRFAIPEWLWRLAPAGQTVHWRALALLPDERRVVARGSLRKRESTASST